MIKYVSNTILNAKTELQNLILVSDQSYLVMFFGMKRAKGDQEDDKQGVFSSSTIHLFTMHQIITTKTPDC